MVRTINNEGYDFDRNGTAIDLSVIAFPTNVLGKADGIGVGALHQQVSKEFDEIRRLNAQLQEALLVGNAADAQVISRQIGDKIVINEKNVNRLFDGLVEIGTQLRQSNLTLENHCADLGIQVQRLGFVLDELQGIR